LIETIIIILFYNYLKAVQEKSKNQNSPNFYIVV
ncbi:unnamed protein product, partial [marine sediment metagenome]